MSDAFRFAQPAKLLSAAMMVAVLLVTGFALDMSTPAQAANEVYTSGERCRNRQSGGREFATDYYVYFETNSSKVRDIDMAKIKRLYGIAKGQSAQQICLFGKASKSGDRDANRRLSEKRARNVAREFEKLGWPKNRFAIGTEGEAWGWMEEMLTSDTLADRRVLIRLSN